MCRVPVLHPRRPSLNPQHKKTDKRKPSHTYSGPAKTVHQINATLIVRVEISPSPRFPYIEPYILPQSLFQSWVSPPRCCSASHLRVAEEHLCDLDLAASRSIVTNSHGFEGVTAKVFGTLPVRERDGALS